MCTYNQRRNGRPKSGGRKESPDFGVGINKWKSGLQSSLQSSSHPWTRVQCLRIIWIPTSRCNLQDHLPPLQSCLLLCSFIFGRNNAKRPKKLTCRGRLFTNASPHPGDGPFFSKRKPKPKPRGHKMSATSRAYLQLVRAIPRSSHRLLLVANRQLSTRRGPIIIVAPFDQRPTRSDIFSHPRPKIRSAPIAAVFNVHQRLLRASGPGLPNPTYDFFLPRGRRLSQRHWLCYTSVSPFSRTPAVSSPESQSLLLRIVDCFTSKWSKWRFYSMLITACVPYTICF